MNNIFVTDLQNNIVRNEFRCHKVKNLVCGDCVFAAKHFLPNVIKCGCYENDFDLDKIKHHEFSSLKVTIEDLIPFKTLINENRYF